MMHEFSTVDGFVEINESLAEMIKYVANEPSVGLFYVQQHIQKAVPNVISLENNVVERTSETNLHTEDLEDSITMLRSMKGCGFPIADEMIGDIRKSLSIMSTKQPKRGLITNTASGPQTRTNSWGPASWGNNGVFGQKDSKATTNYFSTVFKTAKEKASNLKWSQLDPKGATAPQADKPLSYPIPLVLAASSNTGSSIPDVEPDELPLSSQAADETDELREDEEEEEYPVGVNLQLQNVDKDQAGENLPPPDLSSLSENYHDFKADKEAKLEEWLGGTADNNIDKLQK